MTDSTFTHQLQIFTSSSVNREEVERNFPYKDAEEYTFSLEKAVNTLIIMRGGLNDEQQQWLALQKDKGIIERWRVDPIRQYKARGEEYVVSKELRLTFELVPQPCWYSNLRDKMPRSAWDKLRKQIYAQYNYRCGICQTANVKLHCHEIWQYDDELHIQKLQGFIALCPMCHHCKHIGLADTLADQGKLVVSPLSFLTRVVHSKQTEEVRDESETLSQRNGAYRGPKVCATRQGECAHPHPSLGLAETG